MRSFLAVSASIYLFSNASAQRCASIVYLNETKSKNSKLIRAKEINLGSKMLNKRKHYLQKQRQSNRLQFYVKCIEIFQPKIMFFPFFEDMISRFSKIPLLHSLRTMDSIFKFFLFLHMLLNQHLLLSLLAYYTLFWPIISQIQSVKHMVWINSTSASSKNTILGHFIYPQIGFASYFQTQPYKIHGLEPRQRKYFNLYQSSSQVRQLGTIFCEFQDESTFCRSIGNNYLQLDGWTAGNNIIGELREGNQNSKCLQLLDGNKLYFYQHDRKDEIIQFGVTALICLFTTACLFGLKEIKQLDRGFFLQMLIVISFYIFRSLSYVYEAMEDSSGKGYQFCLLVPLVIMSYKILEIITQRSIFKPISIRLCLLVLAVNAGLVSLGNSSLFLQVVSSALIFKCRIQQNHTDGQILQVAERINKQSERNISMLYFTLNVALVFKKLWPYFIVVNPAYFGLRVGVIVLIYCGYLFRRSLEYKKEGSKENRYQIQTITAKTGIVSSSFELNLSSIIEEQCPICHETIHSRWAKTPCGHLFHDYCLYKWLEKSETCPIDRNKVIRDRSAEGKSKVTREPIDF